MTENSLTEIFCAGEVLTLAEVQRLGELEQVVETGLTVFVKVGNALLEIRDSRLYRQQFPTFEAYCRERWGIGLRYSNRLIAAAEVVNTLGPIGPIPQTETQARPLTRLEPEVQQEVWQAVIAETPHEQITAKVVEEKAKAAEVLNEAVKAIKEELKPEPAVIQQPIIPEPVKKKDAVISAVTEKVKAGEMTVLAAAKIIEQEQRTPLPLLSDDELQAMRQAELAQKNHEALRAAFHNALNQLFYGAGIVYNPADCVDPAKWRGTWSAFERRYCHSIQEFRDRLTALQQRIPFIFQVLESMRDE